MDGQMKLVAVKRYEADGLDPHLEDRLGEGSLQGVECGLPMLVGNLGVDRKRHPLRPSIISV